MESTKNANPYASPQLDVSSADGDPLQVTTENLPTRARRFFAALIDLLLVQMAVNFAERYGRRAFASWNIPTDFDNTNVTYDLPDLMFRATVAVAILIVCSTISFLLFEGYLLATRSQTIGKAIFGMKIVRRNGQRAGLFRLVFVRYFLFVVYSYFSAIFVPAIAQYNSDLIGVSLFLLFSPLLDPLFIFTKEKRCLHDYLAGTIVVKSTTPIPTSA